MLGSSVGKMMLNDSSPPTAMQIHACHSKTLYSTLPLTAGFFDAVDERGANVPAVWRASFVRSFSRDVDGVLLLLAVLASSAAAGSSVRLPSRVHTRVCAWCAALPHVGSKQH